MHASSPTWHLTLKLFFIYPVELDLLYHICICWISLITIRLFYFVFELTDATLCLRGVFFLFFCDAHSHSLKWYCDVTNVIEFNVAEERAVWKRSNCCQLIEALSVCAEDLGFPMATLSPSLRHIPTASTHLPKINGVALTPSPPAQWALQSTQFNCRTRSQCCGSRLSPSVGADIF